MLCFSVIRETFLHQNIDIFSINIQSKGKATMVTFFIVLIWAVVCKQRKLHENKLTQYFEPEMR